MPPAATAPCRWLRSILGRFLDAPETNVAIFAFLLNLTWELAQVPLFAGMPPPSTGAPFSFAAAPRWVMSSSPS